MDGSKTIIENLQELQIEVAMATRHAKQLAGLSPEARKRVREQIDRLLADLAEAEA